ncbi:MAG: DUF1850 domain-containing protein [Oscillospiraceae bacterium]|nr:DUF1850 domain-containing protein [Oscillospiraceae bacterium]
MLAVPIEPKETFKLRFTHSVNLSYVTDEMEWTGEQLITRTSLFTSFGAGMPVIADGIGTEMHNTEDGFLIGQVTEVSRSSSTVQTILDSASGVGALTDEGVTAIAEGDFNLMSDGKLRLTYIEDTSRVVAGDKVITSGKGGIYPSGLVIGTVESVSLDPSGLSASAVVEPEADIAAVTYLFIITDYEPEE